MIALAWFLIGYGCGGICVALAMWWVRGHKADFPPSAKAYWGPEDHVHTFHGRDYKPSMADECTAMKREQEAEIAAEGRRQAKAWPASLTAGNGNVVRVTSYTRRKQSKRPKGAPK